MSVNGNTSNENTSRGTTGIGYTPQIRVFVSEETRYEMVTNMIQSVDSLIPDDKTAIHKRNPHNPHNFARKIEQQSFWSAKSTTEYFNQIADRIHEVQIKLKAKKERKIKMENNRKLKASNSLRATIERLQTVHQEMELGIPRIAFPSTSMTEENTRYSCKTSHTVIGRRGKCKNMEDHKKNKEIKSDSEEENYTIECKPPPNTTTPFNEDKDEQRSHVNRKIAGFLECPVCLNVPSTTPVYQCNNGHLICCNCREKLIACPMCRTPLGYSRNLVSEKLLEILT